MACTGEIVSAGLIFTNHHCGYDVIAGASTVEHNYLRDGFTPALPRREIPSTPQRQFLLRIEDVTREVLDSLKGLIWPMERLQRQTVVLTAFINKG